MIVNAHGMTGAVVFQGDQDRVDIDTHGAHNSSSGVYTVPSSGVYQVVSSYTVDQGGYLQKITNNSHMTLNKGDTLDLYDGTWYSIYKAGGVEIDPRIAETSVWQIMEKIS